MVARQLSALAADSARAPNGSEGISEATQGEQGAMIRGMVERLAGRLKENKGDLEGWLKLIRSYAVLKEPGKAQDAAASARQEFASDAKALEKINELARDLGLPAPEEKSGLPKS